MVVAMDGRFFGSRIMAEAIDCEDSLGVSCVSSDEFS